MSSPATQKQTLVGSGQLRYAADPNWCRMPPEEELGEVIGVATDSQDRVFLFTRTPNRLRIFDRDGNFLRTLTDVPFVRPHGIFIGPDDTIYCTDDNGHTVRRFTTDGKLLLTLNPSGQPSDTGATTPDYRQIKQAAGPFCFPTNVALSAQGEICFRRLRQRAGPPVRGRRPTAGLLGASRETGRANSAHRTASRSIATESCWWPIARTAASKGSRPMAG